MYYERKQKSQFVRVIFDLFHNVIASLQSLSMNFLSLSPVILLQESCTIETLTEGSVMTDNFVEESVVVPVLN